MCIQCSPDPSRTFRGLVKACPERLPCRQSTGNGPLDEQSRRKRKGKHINLLLIGKQQYNVLSVNLLEEYIADLDRSISAETERAGARIAARKLEYGEDTEDADEE